MIVKSRLLKLVAFCAFCAVVSTAKAEWVYVQRVIDGDTFEAQNGTKIRIKDIDTPETKHPVKGREPGGAEATALAQVFLEHSYVWLNGNVRDKYGRRVAEVRLRGGRSYGGVVKAYGYDKNTQKVLARPSRILAPEKPKSNKSDVDTANYRFGTDDFTWVNGYYKKNGTYVAGHYRRKPAPASSPVSSAPAESEPSDSTEKVENDDVVHVRGYHRKDGTYVKPYTRSKPKNEAP